MMPEQQQRILGYFIEEAKDHLNTIEQGLLNLQATIQDPEMVSEVFRAAHSVKGGAAMLSLGGIQQTSHRLEDYFKVLKEAPTTQVDRDLETMFLQVFDALQALLEELQGPFGLTEEKAQEVMADVEPVFDRLEAHLNELVAVAPAVAPAAPKVTASVASAQPGVVTLTSSEDSALKLVFSSDVPGHLREMLTLFKQTDTAASRSALQTSCDALKRVGEQFDLSRWCDLVAAARQAVGNPEQTYRSLAPVVIKELKRAQEQVLSGQAAAIAVSAELESLMPMPIEADAAVGDIDSLLDDALATTEETDLSDLFAAESEAVTGAEADLDWLESSNDDLDLTGGDDDLADSLAALTDAPATSAPAREPTVGAAELNSLADLFEGEVSELDSPWEEISESEAAIADTPGPDLELDSDFSDLLEGSLDEEDTSDSSSDLADLFGDPEILTAEAPPLSGEAAETTDDDLDDLLNLTETPAEISEAAAAEGENDGLAALLDGFEERDDDLIATDDLAFDVEAVDATATGDDLDFDLDTPTDAALDLDLDLEAATDTPADDFNFDLDSPADAAFDLDLDLEVTTDSPTTDDEFGGLFDAAESPATAIDLGSSDEPVAAPADTATVAAAMASSDASFEAIADPWSFENADHDDVTDDASALDALDELWTEPADADDADSPELDFADFPELDEVEASAAVAAPEQDDRDVLSITDTDESDNDFEGLFSDPGDSEPLDFGIDEVETTSPEGSFDLTDEADTAADFDALLDDAAPEASDAANDFDALLGESAEDSTDSDLDFLGLDAAEMPADPGDEGGSDFESDMAMTDALLDAADAAPAADDMAELFGAGDDSSDDFLGLQEDEAEGAIADATADLGLDLDEPGEGDAANLDLTFADSGDESLSLTADADFDALAAPSEGLGGGDLEPETSASADLFAEGNEDLAAPEAIAADTDDDFFNTAEESPPTTQAVTNARDDIEDFFTTPELATDSATDSDDSVAVVIEEEPSPPEDTDFEIGEASLETTDDADFDQDFGDEEAVDVDTDMAAALGADFDSLDADSPSEAGLEDFDLGNVDLLTDSDASDLSDLEAGDFDSESATLFDDADAIAATDNGLAVDSLLSATDLTEAASGDLDFDFDESAPDTDFTEAASGDLDFDFDESALDTDFTDAVSGDLDFDFSEEAAAEPDNELFSEAAISDVEGDFENGAGESDALAEPDLASDAADFDDLDALLEAPDADDITSADEEVVPVSDSEFDEFDELDSLLDDEPAADGATMAADAGGIDFDELDALIGDDGTSDDIATSAATDTDIGGDDFGDLEKLLEEADQTLGGSSSSIRSSGPGRSPRRVGGIVDQTMRVSVKHLDNLNNLVGELVVNRNSLEQDQDRFRQFLDNLLFQVQQLNDVGQRMRDLYERSLLESSLLASRQAFQTGGTRFTQTTGGNGDSHATGASFDALEMDRFTGFHTLTQEMIELIVRVRESSSDIAYTVESTDQIARQFRQVTTQLQEGLNKARMVPFAQTADRLPRAVRDISIKCGKEARLIVEGRDTLIDKMLLERLYDPMTHLVNNAITHGIESPEERAALGKPREGKITVRAFYQGNQTVIYIEDDGAGINPDVLKSKAIQKGLITRAEADQMNTLETYELIFRHGFSTRDQADDFAGRGVGMDVVRTALSEIRGAINIDSELGKGTSFTIRLPLTLSISKALSCLNNQARIAFPMDGVEDMFDVPRDRIQTDEKGQSYIQWRDMSLTFQPLSDLLQFNRALGRGRVYGGSQDDDMVSIVVLRNANTYIGIQVDRVLGEQEIVIKQIEGPVPKPMGIAGATVLGDGRVMPIGDVLELIDIAQGRVRREAGSSLWSQVDLPPEDEEPVKTEPTVLIVDDSITVRELLSMSFNKVGYRVEQARDGQEAWEKMRSGLPCDLVFCDIEMPRMDGLELLSRMQKDSLLKNIPIAMLTSRGADRHRQMAVDLGASGYFTKPYLEEALLEAAQRMLKGEVLINQVAEEAE